MIIETLQNAALVAQPVSDSLQAGGVLDWVNNKTSEATTTLRVVITLVAAIVFIYNVVRSKLTLPSIIINGLGAALVLWLVTADGLGWFASRVNEETSAAVFTQLGQIPVPGLF